MIASDGKPVIRNVGWIQTERCKDCKYKTYDLTKQKEYCSYNITHKGRPWEGKYIEKTPDSSQEGYCALYKGGAPKTIKRETPTIDELLQQLGGD